MKPLIRVHSWWAFTNGSGRMNSLHARPQAIADKFRVAAAAGNMIELDLSQENPIQECGATVEPPPMKLCKSEPPAMELCKPEPPAVASSGGASTPTSATSTTIPVTCIATLAASAVTPVTSAAPITPTAPAVSITSVANTDSSIECHASTATATAHNCRAQNTDTCSGMSASTDTSSATAKHQCACSAPKPVSLSYDGPKPDADTTVTDQHQAATRKGPSATQAANPGRSFAVDSTGAPVLPKIYYATRTHAQVEQVIATLKSR